VPVSPRKSGPEERNLEELARSLVEHPGLGARVSKEEIGELVAGGPFPELICALLEDAGERAIDLEALAMRLQGEARDLLRRLAIASDPLDEATAERTVADTLRWLRDQRLRRREREITSRLRDPQAGDDEKRRLLEERQQLLRQKRRSSERGADGNPPPLPPG
jgi:hypothetical protein